MQPGWKLYETAHYFIVTQVEDPGFINELKDRCERIRARIRKDFPHPELDPVPVRTAPNVIRALKGRDEFFQYGGPGGSAGYWSPNQGEIVLYDDRAVGGWGATWATLNGLVWLEYVAELHGAPAPPPWFAYGHSDYYSGFVLEDNEYQVRPFDWRQRPVQALIRDGEALALRDLIGLNLDEYAGRGPRSLSIGDTYALGWSFVWFLRRGPHEPRYWDAAWDRILDTWWSTWLETRNDELATEVAFAGVDWENLQRAWARFILK